MSIRRHARWPRILPYAAVVFAGVGCRAAADLVIERALARADRTVLTSPGVTVVLCGTGSPLADAARAGACTAVVAAGRLVLVDVGPGSWETADLASLPVAEVRAILLTHFHSDHIGDLGEAMTQSWIAGRRTPLPVYGPPGTARVVDGFVAAYAQDADARAALHGPAYMPRTAAAAVAHEVALDAGPDAAAPVLEEGGLRITMFRVDHPSVASAVGYRFDYRGRAVVVSGDTVRSANLTRQAHGADILVHEALDPALLGTAVRVARRSGRERLAAMVEDGLRYHASPVDVATAARDAGVRILVFSHLIPGPTNAITRRLFVAGVSSIFAGTVVVGHDGQRFVLPPREG